MIIRNLNFKTRKSGPGGNFKQGFLAIPSDVSHRIGMVEKEITVVFIPKSEKIDIDKLKEELIEHRKMCQLSEIVERMKKSLMKGEKWSE